MISPIPSEFSKFQHAAYLILFLACFALMFSGLSGLRLPPDSGPHSRYHDASLDLETAPVTNTQAYYEAARNQEALQTARHAAQRELDETPFLETPEEKRARILARDEAALLSNLQTAKP